MSQKRVPLYDRLPEIYRTRDVEQSPPGQLKHYLELVELAFGAIHENIESLYHDLFIDTCDDWVIPYIGDLLGTSHLKGDAWTLRADVADTIALRRRKGTLGAIERLTYNLTRWGVHCVELRENLVWNQHLNHQRPDEGGIPPYSLPSVTRFTPIRGGTIPVRDPALLSLLNTPFDPFAHVVDVKPPALGTIRYNLPNLAIFLWRLAAYRVAVHKPVSRGVQPGMGGGASWVVRFDVQLPEPNPADPTNPFTRPVRLFNINRYAPDRQPPTISQIDETPGPIPTPRLSQDAPAGAPEKYVTVDLYNPANLASQPLDIGETGLQLHLPESPFAGTTWMIRGENLCAWETSLQPPLQSKQVVIDPVIGRLAIGVDTEEEANALVDRLLLTYTYGAVGPVGAHPISRVPAPDKWPDEHGDSVIWREVNFHRDANELRDALNNLEDLTAPVVVEILDSMTHELDIDTVIGIINEDGGANLQLSHSLIIRAASDQRPIIRLARPLRFRPTTASSSDPEEQERLDGLISRLTVRLEGLYLTRGEGFPADEPLIARAALHSLEIINCTLDPGGSKILDKTQTGDRAPIRPAIRLREPYGFDDATDEDAFKETPEIILQRTISGPLLIDSGYKLSLTDTILDAGKGVKDTPDHHFAVSGAGDPATTWGPPTRVNGITVFGRMRVESICGRGGIWVHALEVLNNQQGCLKFSYFSGVGDRLPQNHACVTGSEALLRFVSEVFGHPAYGQLHHTTDFRIRERGPNDDAMGAFGFLLEAHKWRNLQIRFREFMPVGIRPLLIPVT